MSDYCVATVDMAAFQSSVANFTKHIKVKTVGYMVLFFLFMMVNPSSANYELLISEDCTHFNLSEGQAGNAFHFDGRECCLCGIGTKITGVCNATDPLSTVCEACGKDEYRDFEPHMQAECEPQIKKNCRDPRVLSEGSISKASKCVCKPGFEELDRRCVPVQNFASPVTKPSINIDNVAPNLATTRFDTANMYKEPATTLPSTTGGIGTTTPDVPITMFKGVTTTTIHDVTDGPSFDNTEKSSETFPDALSITLSVIIALVVLILFVAFLVFCKKYQDKHKKSDAGSVGYTPGSTPVLGSSHALVRRKRRSRGCFPNISTNRDEENATTNREVHEQRVDEVDIENGSDSRSSVCQPSADQCVVSVDETSSTEREIEPLLQNIENTVEQSKNMAAPTGCDLNPDRIRRELPIVSGDDIGDNSRRHVICPVENNLPGCQTAAAAMDQRSPNDRRLSPRHKELRSKAIVKIVPVIYPRDVTSLGHLVIPNDNELEYIKERYSKDGNEEIARQVFRRGLELNPNLSLYNLRDKAKELGLGYLVNDFEDHIVILEHPEGQPAEQA